MLRKMQRNRSEVTLRVERVVRVDGVLKGGEIVYNPCKVVHLSLHCRILDHVETNIFQQGIDKLRPKLNCIRGGKSYNISSVISVQCDCHPSSSFPKRWDTGKKRKIGEVEARRCVVCPSNEPKSSLPLV